MSNKRLRQVGFGSTVATGLVLLGLGAQGVAGMDDRLARAAEATRIERSVQVIERDAHDGRCRDRERRTLQRDTEI